MENLLLNEAEFDEFKRFCRNKGFDLSYYISEISGPKEEVERYPFDSPEVIKPRKRRVGFAGIPYDVAEWQSENCKAQVSVLKEKFFQKAK